MELATEGRHADLILGNNVLAHVPDLNDFVKGMKIALKHRGIITMEFPHLMRLMEENQFDTIYHEHFSYFSFITVKEVFDSHGLKMFDVNELPTYGGSLRIYACHADDSSKLIEKRVSDLIKRENDAGFNKLEHYLSFTEKVKQSKRNILDFLIREKGKGKSFAGYGAPAKGNTLLNYCGVRIAGREIHGLVNTFGDRQPGELVALLGEANDLTISIVNGDAAGTLGVGAGELVEIISD